MLMKPLFAVALMATLLAPVATEAQGMLGGAQDGSRRRVVMQQGLSAATREAWSAGLSVEC